MFVTSLYTTKYALHLIQYLLQRRLRPQSHNMYIVMYINKYKNANYNHTNKYKLVTLSHIHVHIICPASQSA